MKWFLMLFCHSYISVPFPVEASSSSSWSGWHDSQPDTMQSLNWKFPPVPSPHGGGGLGVRGNGGHKRTWTIEYTKQVSHGLIETETANRGPAWVCTRSSTYMLWLSAWCFCGNPNSGNRHISDFFSTLEPLFSYWVALLSLYMRDFPCLIVLVLFCLAATFMRSAVFWRGNMGGGIPFFKEKGKGQWEEGFYKGGA